MPVAAAAQSLCRTENRIVRQARPVASRGRRRARPCRQALVRRRILFRRVGFPGATLCGRPASAYRASPTLAGLVLTAEHASRRDGRRLAAARWCGSAIVAGSLALALVGAMIAPKSVAPAELGTVPIATPAPAASLLDRTDRDIARDAAAREVDRAEIKTGIDAAPEISDPVRQAIDHATRMVGVDAGYLLAVAARESGLDPQARARHSSAVGLYQFTAGTWLRAVKMFGAKHGLGDYAEHITIDDDGLVSMHRGAERQALLKLRSDPGLASLMAAELARDNKLRLERILGRTVTPAETYLAHLFGVMPAARVIDAARSAPGVPGAHLLPSAARTNPHLFQAAGALSSAADIVTSIGADFNHRAALARASI